MSFKSGGLAQMVERVLCMHKVPGSIPGSSNHISKYKHEYWILPENSFEINSFTTGLSAQMVQRVLSLHDVLGSITGFSNYNFVAKHEFCMF